MGTVRVWDRYPCISGDELDVVDLIETESVMLDEAFYSCKFHPWQISATGLFAPNRAQNDDDSSKRLHPASVLYISSLADLRKLQSDLIPYHLCLVDADSSESDSDDNEDVVRLKNLLDSSKVRAFAYNPFRHAAISTLLQHDKFADSSALSHLAFCCTTLHPCNRNVVPEILHDTALRLHSVVVYDYYEENKAAASDTDTHTGSARSPLAVAIMESQSCASLRCLGIVSTTLIDREALKDVFEAKISGGVFSVAVDYCQLYMLISDVFRHGVDFWRHLRRIVFCSERKSNYERLNDFLNGVVRVLPELQSLHVPYCWDTEIIYEIGDMLSEIRSYTGDRIRSLRLEFKGAPYEPDDFFRVLGKYTKHLDELWLDVDSSKFLHDLWYAILNNILEPPQLLKVSFIDGLIDNDEDFLDFLRSSNQRLNGLEIRCSPEISRFNNREWKVAMALRENRIICRFCYPWTSSQAQASAASTLLKNRFKEEFSKIKMVRPDTAKLFLCGHGGVGKTTVRKGLSKAAFLHEWRNKLFCVQHVEPRTRGMEFHRLSFPNTEGLEMKLVLCDLAGQHSYHAFHHFFVSDSNANLFLIVCKWQDGMGQEIFNLQLEYWLRFIVSHRSSARSDEGDDTDKPRVILLVNFFNYTGDLENEARRLTRELIAKYSDVLNFNGTMEHSREPTFLGVVATKSSTYAKHLKDKLQMYLIDLLKHREHIPETCKLLSNEVLPGVRNSLFETYSKMLQLYSKKASNQDSDQQKTFHTALLELHRAGEIIYFPRKSLPKEQEGSNSRTTENIQSTIIVTNSTWFCNELIGDLLAPKEFHMRQNELRLTAKWDKSEIYAMLRNKRFKSKKFKIKNYREEMIRYLERLGLCTFDPSDPSKGMLLFPALLSDKAMYWPRQAKEDHLFFGRRLKCENSEKNLIPFGIFTRLQIMLNQNNYGEGYRLWNCHASFIQNGIAVVVRYGGGELEEEENMQSFNEWNHNWKDYHWIDILMFIPKEDSNISVNRVNEASQLMEQLREDIFKICQGITDYRAIPTVQLTECVLRDRNSTTLFRPTTEISKAITEKGWTRLCWTSDSDRTAPPQETFDAKDFLFPSEMESQVSFQSFKIFELCSQAGLNRAILEEGTNYKDVEDDIISDLTEGERRIWKLNDMRFQLIISKLKNIEEGIAAISKKLERMENNIISKCSTHMVQQLLQGSLPIYPYFEDIDKDKLQKLRASISGEHTRLHFLCEDDEFPHKVKNQPGIKVTISRPEWVQKLASVVFPALTILCCTGKLAATMFLPGMQNFIPTPEFLDFLDLGSTPLQEVILPELLKQLLDSPISNKPDDLSKWLEPGYQLEREHVKSCLVDVLGNRDIDMYRDFKLRRVKVTSGVTDKRIAWVCKKHAMQPNKEILLKIQNPFNIDH